mmetsp:Transcript_106962/g.297869  ORF Transcript_106962/g.297869 Transcript_106962/m.297869 type:complete len:219 (+) Transcript_106962:700-1356(+)
MGNAAQSTLVKRVELALSEVPNVSATTSSAFRSSSSSEVGSGSSASRPGRASPGAASAAPSAAISSVRAAPSLAGPRRACPAAVFRGRSSIPRCSSSVRMPSVSRRSSPSKRSSGQACPPSAAPARHSPPMLMRSADPRVATAAPSTCSPSTAVSVHGKAVRLAKVMASSVRSDPRAGLVSGVSDMEVGRGCSQGGRCAPRPGGCQAGTPPAAESFAA